MVRPWDYIVQLREWTLTPRRERHPCKALAEKLLRDFERAARTQPDQPQPTGLIRATTLWRESNPQPLNKKSHDLFQENAIRWLTAYEIYALGPNVGDTNQKPPQPWIAVEGFRESLAKDGASLAAKGFQTKSDTKVDPDTWPDNRLIPHQRPLGLVVGESLPRTVSLVFRAKPVAVGRIGAPATCPEKLFTAIEDLDWRMWACERFIGLRQKNWLVEWESVKNSSLLDASKADVLERLFTSASRKRDDIRRLLPQYKPGGQKPSDHIHSHLHDLDAALSEVEKESLDQLHKISPIALQQLCPPRTPAGAIDIVGAFASDCFSNLKMAKWKLCWKPSAEPLGQQLSQTHDDDGNTIVTFSGEQASDLDLRLLNLLSRSNATSQAGSLKWAGVLRQCRPIALKAVSPDGDKVSHSAFTLDALATFTDLRDRLADDKSGQFDCFIKDFLVQEKSAVEWHELLSDDPRVNFQCHPNIDRKTHTVAAISSCSKYLDWKFSETVPRGQDIEIRYAMDPDHAKRVVSRGPQVLESLAYLAELVEAAGLQAGNPIAQLASELRIAIDRWQQFPYDCPLPPIEEGKKLLDALPATHDVSPSVISSVFSKVIALFASESLGYAVVPSDWDPREGPPAAFASDGVGPADFHDWIPAGRVAVTAFGLRTLAGTDDRFRFTGFTSAGPTPKEYPQLVAAVDEAVRRADENPLWLEVRRRLRELPKHSLAKTLGLAVPNFFDCVWEASGSESGPQSTAAIRAVQDRTGDILKGACKMLLFEPHGLSDYPAVWIRERNGNSPRGTRIVRLARPGIRTLDNTLIRTALVDTE